MIQMNQCVLFVLLTKKCKSILVFPVVSRVLIHSYTRFYSDFILHNV